ncbi:MAG: hypothetical protein GX772_05655 [Alcaligenaceae bacterium]|nr:hypothetical protein [Alcaligenaceae bacterium]
MTTNKTTNFRRSIVTIFIALSLLAVTSVSADQKWYEGGTLHSSALSDWAAAPQKNRVATAADFAASIAKKAGKPFKNQVEMRLVALEITLCIDEAAKEAGLGTQETAVIAIMCAQQLRLM